MEILFQSKTILPKGIDTRPEIITSKPMTVAITNDVCCGLGFEPKILFRLTTPVKKVKTMTIPITMTYKPFFEGNMAKTQKESKIRIKLKSYDSRIIDISSAKIVDTAVRTGAKVVGPVPLPTKTERFTVIRGPHIDKRSREQFELKTHKRVIDVLNPTNSTIENLSRLNLPAGVGISIKM